MKKLLILALILAGGVAGADSSITSKQYVDTVLDTLQPQVPAKNTDTVLTHTGTAGEIGEKKIYNTNNSYNEQTDALVTAETFNTALQNALASEFVCTEWQGDVHDNAHCLLYEVRGATQRQILPDGYTQLEYLESTGTQYIDTNTYLNGASKLEFEFMTDAVKNYAVFGASNGFYYTTGEISLFYYENRGIEAVKPLSNKSSSIITPRPAVARNTKYTIKYDKDNLIVNGKEQASNWYSEYIGQRTAYLFASNRGADSWIGGNTKIYWFKIYDNNGLIRDFMPARRNSDGELGMYDLVSGGFFTNIGTGEFIAGADADSNLYIPSEN